MPIIKWLRGSDKDSKNRGVFRPTAQINIDKAWHDTRGDDFIRHRIGLTEEKRTEDPAYAHSSNEFLDTATASLLQSFSNLSLSATQSALAKSFVKKDIHSRDIFGDLNDGLQSVRSGRSDGYARIRDYDFSQECTFSKLELISAFCFAAYVTGKLQDEDILPLVMHPETFIAAKGRYQERLAADAKFQSEGSKRRAQAVQLNVEDNIEFLIEQPASNQLLWAQILSNMLADDLTTEARWIVEQPDCSQELAYLYRSAINEWLWEDLYGPTSIDLETARKTIARLQEGNFAVPEGWLPIERPQPFDVEKFNSRLQKARERHRLSAGHALQQTDLDFLLEDKPVLSSPSSIIYNQGLGFFQLPVRAT